MTKAHIYFNDGKTKFDFSINVVSMKAGRAIDILGDDARGNGIPDNASIIQFQCDDGNTSTFDARNITVLF